MTAAGLPHAQDHLGHYRLLREIGRGGQAVVWLAEDTRIGRRVALKILLALGPGSTGVLHRFRREAEVTSSLEHAAICPVYDADLEGSVPFIAMRFVEGETLAKRIASTRAAGGRTVALTGDAPTADWNAIATFFARIAHALHLAHEAGVVHRDIKPANLMVTPQGEPVILDFGLARQDDPDALAMSAEHSGTPHYMSPEQMTGRTRPDRRSDVYSLGCTLFECLAGRPPFEAATVEGLFHAVLHDEAPNARSVHGAVPTDLAVIAATASEKEPDRRYKSALDLAVDLERFVRREPVAARPITRTQRILRWMQRNPALAASLGAVTVLILVATVVSSYGIGAAGRAAAEALLRQQADAQRARAEGEQERMLQATADRDLTGRIDELQMQLGTLMFGVDGGAEAAVSLLPAYAAVLREAGLDLAAADAVEKGRALVVRLRARDPDAGRSLLDALRNLADLGTADSAQQQNLLRLLGEFQDPRQLAVAAARGKWDRDRVDEFGPLLQAQALRDLEAEQLADLASAIMDLPGRAATALRLFDRALLAKPDSFAIHYQCAGLSLARVIGGAPGTDAVRLAQNAVEHFQVAMALRPSSGLTRAALASVLALRAHLSGDDSGFQPAWELMQTATQVDPRNGLVWYMRANFLQRMTQGRDAAVEACRKALELDPQLVPAQRLLAQLTK